MIDYLKKTTALLVVGLLSASVAQADNAAELGEKMLAAMGGAAVWKEAAAVHNIAINHHPQARLPYIQEYWYFTRAPRHVVKINNHDMQRMRSYTEAGGWSMVEGNVQSFSDERLAREISSWHRSLYRKVVLLAHASGDLTLSIGEDGSVEFYESGEFAGWMEIGDDGVPKRHGGVEDRSVYTVFEPLIPFGEISWPSGGYDETGWRFEMLSIELLEKEPEIGTAPPVEKHSNSRWIGNVVECGCRG